MLSDCTEKQYTHIFPRKDNDQSSLLINPFQSECLDSDLHVHVCPGMAKFSQQRQSWTRQPTNVKVSKVINSQYQP